MKHQGPYFTCEHEWIERDTPSILTLGITEYGQAEIGDIVYVDLPSIGAQYTRGNVILVVESSKAALDICTPLSGTVLAVNTELSYTPELINQDPLRRWLVKLQVEDLMQLEKELQHLMGKDAYTEYCKTL